jgi:hypothetical protein
MDLPLPKRRMVWRVPWAEITNPATQYIAFRASSLPLIKARLAGNGPVLVKSRNAEQGQA